MSVAKAKESTQVHKARKKIQQQLDAAEKKLNPDALQAMRRIIQKQIARHQSERINLKDRTIKLFDENQHPAKTESRFISKLLHELQNKSEPADNDLEGRIKPI